MNKKLKYVLSNSAFMACILAGFMLPNEGLQNVSMLWAWFCIAASLTANFDSVKAIATREMFSVPHWVDVTLDVVVISVFAYYGSIVTASFYLAGVVSMAALRLHVEEKK